MIIIKCHHRRWKKIKEKRKYSSLKWHRKLLAVEDPMLLSLACARGQRILMQNLYLAPVPHYHHVLRLSVSTPSTNNRPMVKLFGLPLIFSEALRPNNPLSVGDMSSIWQAQRVHRLSVCPDCRPSWRGWKLFSGGGLVAAVSYVQ